MGGGHSEGRVQPGPQDGLGGPAIWTQPTLKGAALPPFVCLWDAAPPGLWVPATHTSQFVPEDKHHRADGLPPNTTCLCVR